MKYIKHTEKREDSPIASNISIVVHFSVHEAEEINVAFYRMVA
jgi:hypothetical protein